MIEGARVALRALERGDLGRSLAWYNDPEIAFLLGRTPGTTAAEQEAWFDALARGEGERAFAIVERTRGHIGNVYLRHIDRRRRRAVAAIVIGEKTLWGRGLGREALGLLLEFAFRELGLRRVGLEVLEGNERAIRAYRALGFRVVGRRDELLLGRPAGILRMAVTPRRYRPAAPGAQPLSIPGSVGTPAGELPCPGAPSANGTSSTPMSSASVPPAAARSVPTIGPPTTTG